jgi:hypothetical protein
MVANDIGRAYGAVSLDTLAMVGAMMQADARVRRTRSACDTAVWSDWCAGERGWWRRRSARKEPKERKAAARVTCDVCL